MTNEEKKKLIGTNAAVLTVAALASFVLPLILDSLLEGRGNFIKAMAQMLPLLAAIPWSSRLIAVACEPSDSPS